MKNIIILSLFIFVTLTSCSSQKTTNSDIESTNQSTSSSNQEIRRSGDQREGRQGPPSIDQVFEMDADNDGRLTKSEVKGPLLNDFSKIDSNDDGYLTKEEVKNAPKPQRGQRPQRQ